MSGLVFACIAPHGSYVIPALAGEEGQKALTTRASMEKLERCMAAARPETVVVMTPHGHRVDGCFSLLNNRRLRGELSPSIPGSSVGGNAVTLELEADQELNAAMVETARSLDVPVSRIGYAVPDDPSFSQELDWGVTVPLWFLGGLFHPQPRVVVACSDRGKMPWDLFPRFGAVVRQAAETVGRRIAFIASADMGHAHDKDGPYGYDPVSAEFDAATVEAVKAQDLGRLLTFDQAWVQQAATDAYGQILSLHGAIEGTGFRGRFLSYEVPTYFGMMCVAYEQQTSA